MSAPVIVVGAGAAGLGAASVLAERGPVTVVDRIPVAGGSAHYERPDVRAWVATAARAGARFLLGATAVRWQDHRLLVCAPGDIRWHPASLLAFAGGLRPATAAELGLAGDRPGRRAAGPGRPAPARGLGRPWRRVVILGDGPGAADAATLIAGGGGDRDPPSTRASGGERPLVSVVGRDHVSALRIERNGTSELIACDAVLLAAEPGPVRNVDGAIADDADGVAYLQDVGGSTFEATAQAAAAAVVAAARAGGARHSDRDARRSPGKR